MFFFTLFDLSDQNPAVYTESDKFTWNISKQNRAFWIEILVVFVLIDLVF